MQINSCRSQLCETIQARGGPSTYQYTDDKKGPKQQNRLAATARAACDAFSKASQLSTPVSAYPTRKAKPQLWGPSVVASTEEAVAKSSAAFAASRDFIALVDSLHNSSKFNCSCYFSGLQLHPYKLHRTSSQQSVILKAPAEKAGQVRQSAY